MNKLYLLTKPCQSGKTQKTFEFILQTREKQYVNFLQTCPEFERMIISSGIQLINTGSQ